MPAQVEFCTQAHVTYDYFGHHCSREQESQEEALWLVRDFHCQALATAAMLEGHIEQLSHSISWGHHGSQRQSCRHWWSRSRRHSRSDSHSRIHKKMSASQSPRTDTPIGRLPWGCSQEVGGTPQLCMTQEVGTPQALCDPGGGQTHQCNPEGRQTHPALCGPGGRSTLKMQVLTPVWKWSLKWQTGHGQ